MGHLLGDVGGMRGRGLGTAPPMLPESNVESGNSLRLL